LPSIQAAGCFSLSLKNKLLLFSICYTFRFHLYKSVLQVYPSFVSYIYKKSIFKKVV